MRRLKNIALLALGSIILITSCSKEGEDQPMEEFNLNEESLDLNLKAFDSFGEEFDIPNNDVIGFLSKNYSDLEAMPEDMEVTIMSRQNNSFFKIELVENEVDKSASINRNIDPPGFYDTVKECKVCRDRGCIESTLASAIGDGFNHVEISVRPKYTLGVRTGVEICWEYYKN